MSKECLLEFIRKLAFEGAEPARQYAREVYQQIVSGQAWDLVAERRRVSEKNEGHQYERQALAHGFRHGDKPMMAHAPGGYSFSEDDGYDVKQYAHEWVESVKQIT